MCKYCEKDKRKKRDCIINTPIVSLRIIRNNGFNALAIKSYNLEKQVVDSYQTINYCPKCRKEAGRVNKEEIVQRLKFVADEIDKDIKIFEETHNFEHIYDYNVYSIKEFIDEFINIMNTMKEETSNDK